MNPRRFSTLRFAAAALAVGVTMATPPLHAQTCTVPGTHVTIQEAIDDLLAGATLWKTGPCRLTRLLRNNPHRFVVVIGMNQATRTPVVAMVLSTVGYHWEEAFGAFDEFLKAGWEIKLFTVDGSPPEVDPSSLKRTGPLSLFGLGVSRANSPESERGRELTAVLEAVRPLSELQPDEVDALYLPGGHGCLFDINRNQGLHRVAAELHRAGKPLTGVCHATSTYAFVEEDGRSIVAGKAFTGFPEFVDTIMSAAGLVQKQFLPIPFSNDQALEDAGADLKWHHKLLAALNPRYRRIDWPFVTGMGPKAARGVARAVIRQAEEKA